jgi:hypothetical protein
MTDIESLARILGDYELRLSKPQLQSALEDESFVEWAATHLHPGNLLTVDELAL